MFEYGYKAFYSDLENKYGEKLELNKIYSISGDVSWNKRGFHFCKHLEDCFRYVDGHNNNIEIVYVLGFGKIEEYNDEYFGYYDMFVSNHIVLLKKMSLEEIQDYMKSKRNLNCYKINSYPYSLDDNIVRKR